MITNAILALVNVIVGAVDSLLPSFTLPSFFSGGSILPTDVVNFFAAAFSMISPFFPSALLLSILSAAAALWTPVLAYLVFQWICKHTPTIAGFGLMT
jgi:hypothetical protein